MPTLEECLNASSRRMLRAVARARSVPLRGKWLKPELVAILSEALAVRRANRRLVGTLPPSEQELLRVLIGASGKMPRLVVEARFGAVRPYRPWRDETPERPWDQPASPTERLVFLGLVFVVDSEVVVPSDLLRQYDSVSTGVAALATALPATALSATVLSVTTTSAALPSASPPPAPDVLDAIHDIAVLLALLDRCDVPAGTAAAPWLPPSIIEAWGQHCARPPRATSRSERRTSRRRFLHYLIKGPCAMPSPAKGEPATADDPPALVDPTGGYLKPTAAAHSWLDAPPAVQARTLLHRLARLDAVRWRELRLPGYTLPIAVNVLIDAIVRQPWLPVGLPDDALAAWLMAHHPALHIAGRSDAQPARLGMALRALACGPLAWLGMMQPAAEDVEAIERSPWAASWPDIDAVMEALAPALPLPPKPTGADWVLEVVDSDPPKLRVHAVLAAARPVGGFAAPAARSIDDPRAIPTHTVSGNVRSNTAWPVTLPRAADVFWLEAMAEDADGSAPNPRARPGASRRWTAPADRSFDITASSYAAALRRGHTRSRLVAALGAAIGGPIRTTERGLLSAWAAAADRVVIRMLPVLETTDPALITALAGARPRRSLVRRTLGPRAVTIDAAHIPALVRKITTLTGAPPRLEMFAGSEMPGLADQPAGRTAAIRHSRDPVTDAGSAAQLWLAARVYQTLGRWAPLPGPVSQHVMDNLARRLSPAARAAADQAAEDVIGRLADAMDGYLGVPADMHLDRALVDPPTAHGADIANAADADVANPDHGNADIANAAEAIVANPDPANPDHAGAEFASPECLARIEAALASGDNLDITYYTAGRGETSRRIVEPFRLDWRRGVPYLVAFCQRAGAERVFRLDRISAIAPIAAPRDLPRSAAASHVLPAPGDTPRSARASAGSDGDPAASDAAGHPPLPPF